MSVHTHTHTYTHIHVHTYTMHPHPHTYKHIHVHTYTMHPYPHTYKHIHTHTYTHTHRDTHTTDTHTVWCYQSFIFYLFLLQAAEGFCPEQATRIQSWFSCLEYE